MSAYPFVSMSDKQCQRGTDDIPIPGQEIIPCQGLSLDGTPPGTYKPLPGGGAVILLGRVFQKPYE